MRNVVGMFAEFVRTKVAGSVLLLLATIVALVAAKSSFCETYFHFWETEIVLEVAGFEFHQTIHHLINDGLMALFFFVVGLEIKRELLGLGSFLRFAEPRYPFCSSGWDAAGCRDLHACTAWRAGRQWLGYANGDRHRTCAGCDGHAG
jgi:Na+/H+ antiporter NhaA